MDEFRITFLVVVPTNTPEDANIYITGNHAKLGEWAPEEIALKRVAPAQYQISFVFPKGTELNFKFCRGNWSTVEKNNHGQDVEDRKLTVKRGGVFPFRVESWGDAVAPRHEVPHTKVGNIKEHPNFYARKLDIHRPVWVYLPPSYETSKKRYPVMYAHDGNNCFDSATAFMGVEWELDETAEQLTKEKKMREIIIVAMGNTINRDSEYTHVYMPGFGGGRADLYADFIIHDLKPFIDENYRTLKDRQYTGVMGSSLGGLVSLYIGWKYHRHFSMAGVISPSIWWANRHILRWIRKSKKPDIRIWLDIGTLEGGLEEGEEISYAVRDTRDLRDLLIEKGFRLNQDLEYLEVEGGEHNEAAWARRVDKILLFFFGAKTSFFHRLFRFRG